MMRATRETSHYPELNPFLERLQVPLTDLARRRAEATAPQRTTAATTRVLTLTRPASRRRRLAVGMAAAAALAAGAVVVPGLLPGGGGTPSAAAATLEQAALSASRQPAAQLAAGQYWYTKTKTDEALTVWVPRPGAPPESRPTRDGNGSMDKGPATATLHRVGTREVITERWVGSDGSGRVRVVLGTPSFTNAQDRAAWERSQANRREPGNRDERLSSLPLVDGYPYGYAQLMALPTDSAALAERLRQEIADARSAKGDAPGRAELDGYVAAAALGLLQQGAPATPALRAALFHVAADTPGWRTVGTVRDALGRSGTGIARTEPDNSVVTFVVDPDSGQLLSRTYEANGQRDSLTLVASGTVGTISATPQS